MRIKRRGKDKSLSEEFRILDIQLETGRVFRLTEGHNGLKINEKDGNTITVSPCCANEIVISSTSDWQGPTT